MEFHGSAPHDKYDKQLVLVGFEVVVLQVLQFLAGFSCAVSFLSTDGLCLETGDMNALLSLKACGSTPQVSFAIEDMSGAIKGESEGAVS